MAATAVSSSRDEPRPGSRAWQKWARGGGALAAFLLVALVLGLIALLHSLDHRWVKSRIVSAVKGAVGLDVDYATLSVAVLHGVTLRGLVVRSPEEMRGVAPELLRVGTVEIGWEPRSLLRRHPTLGRVSISDVALSVVTDDKGRTSFDAIPSSSTKAAAPPAPVLLSHLARGFLGGTLPVRALDVGPVSLTVVQTDDGRVVGHVQLSGLGVVAVAKPAEGEPGSEVLLDLGTDESPLALSLSQWKGEIETKAHGLLAIHSRVTSSSLSVRVDLRVSEQSFAPGVVDGHWLQAEVSARFEPAASRIVVTMDKLVAGDGSASVDATVEIPDQGSIVVRHAAGTIDAARILRWLPTGLVPVTAERAELRYDIAGLVVEDVPRLAEGGAATVDAALSNVHARFGATSLAVDLAKVTLVARPGAGSPLRAHASLVAGSLQVTSPGQHVAVEGVELEAEGEPRAAGPVSGRADVRVRHLDLSGATPLSLDGAHVGLVLKDFTWGAADLLGATGDLTLTAAAPSVDASFVTANAHVSGLTLRAHSRLTGHAPYAVDVDAPMDGFRLVEAGGAVLADAPGRLRCTLHDAFFAPASPRASRGVVHLAIDLAELEAVLDATKGADAVDYSLHANTPTLSVARPWIPRALLSDAPWDRIGVTLQSSGRVEHLFGARSIKHATEVSIARGAFRGVSAALLAVKVESSGTTLVHEATVDLRATALAWPGSEAADGRAVGALRVDRVGRSLSAEVSIEGRASAKVAMAASFDATAHAVAYSMDAELAKLSPLTAVLAKVPGLSGLDLADLALGVSSRGVVTGVVDDLGQDGSVRLAPRPLLTAAVVGGANVQVTGLRWAREGASFSASKASWHADLGAQGARRTIASHLDVADLHVGEGAKDADLVGLVDDAKISVTGDLADPSVEVSDKSTLAAARQSFVPGYPVGDVAIALDAEQEKDGVIHVKDLKVRNGAGGTTLGLSGNVEMSARRRILSVALTFGQDLALLSGMPDRFKGRGQLAVDAHVTSADLSVLRLRAMLKANDVSLTIPGAGVEILGASGEIPVLVSLAVSKDGVSLRPDEKRSAYSMLRFADQHPLLASSGFVSMKSLKTRVATLAPFAGNVSIERNVISVRQFEVGVRGGTVTGQLAVDWDGPKSTAELHVRATGVQSSHGEPFDGNIAVVVSAADRTVEGRADILRMGQRHLLDLLDLADTSRADPGMNRIRTALRFGYPDRLRLSFDHGFANARLELGGLARIITIGEVRGIPMGPIIDNLLASDDTKAVP